MQVQVARNTGTDLETNQNHVNFVEAGEQTTGRTE